MMKSEEMDINTAEEVCRCDTCHPVALQYALTDDVIVCSWCNLTHSDIKISDELSHRINKWRQGYSEVYLRWLHDDTDQDTLIDPQWTINELGLAIVSKMNVAQPTYYWWHTIEGRKYSDCPVCDGALASHDNGYTGKHQTCESCRVLISAF